MTGTLTKVCLFCYMAKHNTIYFINYLLHKISAHVAVGTMETTFPFLNVDFAIKRSTAGAGKEALLFLLVSERYFFKVK